MKTKATYRIDRNFCEKLVALMNHGTIPIMDIFNANREIKMRIVIDYDPHFDKVEVSFLEEEKH